MEIKQLYSCVRRALQDYNMIEDGDRVALGLSGGKDSLALLYALSGLRRFYPAKFELLAITVNLGSHLNEPLLSPPLKGADIPSLNSLKDLCKALGVEYHIVETKINTIVESRDGGCSLCSRLRKGALNEKALELSCNKIAYAHNMDDVVETMILSLIYEGRISTFFPVTNLSKNPQNVENLIKAAYISPHNTPKTKKLKDDLTEDIPPETPPSKAEELTLIRPLIYAPEAKLKGFAKKYDLPVLKNSCKYAGKTQRSYVKELLNQINRHSPGVRQRIMTAILNGKLEGWDLEPAFDKNSRRGIKL